jgi:hypothetical protein
LGVGCSPDDLDLLTVDELAYAGREVGLPVLALVERLVETDALLLAVEAPHPDKLVLVLLAHEAADDHYSFGVQIRDDLLLEELDPSSPLSRPGPIDPQLEEHWCPPR